MKNGRDGLGRFVVGNPGGPGRPRRATEAAYQQALSRVLSAADLEAIARRAVADARRGSARARDWVSAYLLGNPIPPETTRGRNLQGMARAQLQAILETISVDLTAPEPAAGGGLAPAPAPSTGAPAAQGPAGHERGTTVKWKPPPAGSHAPNAQPGVTSEGQP